MENIPYIIDLLKRKFAVETEVTDFGYESTLLERDELDLDMLPDYFDEIQTEKEVLIHFYSTEDYTIYIVADSDNSEWKLIGVMNKVGLIYSEKFD